MNQMIRHTLILEPAEWHVEGKYSFGAANLDASGTIRITHDLNEWQFESEIHVDERDTVRNNFTIQPWKDGADYLNWESDHPKMGLLKGKFLLIEETIISQFASNGGKFIGSEVMLHQEEDKYYTRGIIFKENDKIASWSYRLEKLF